MKGDNMKKPLYVLRNGIVVQDLGDADVEVVSMPPHYVDEFAKDPVNAGKWRVGTVHTLIYTGVIPRDPLHYEGGAWGRNFDVISAFDDYSVPSASWILRFLRWLFEGSKE
jgi:hypothetical protein